MRLKYYLKGLGIGMIIAALLMGIATREPATLTDEEIKIRAKELGMVEQKTLADTIKPTEMPEEIKPQETPTPQEEMEPVITKEPVNVEPEDEEVPPEETEIPIEEEPIVTEEPTAQPEKTEPPIVSEAPIVFEILKGESSDSISKRLEEQGFVENGSSFNNYLCNNGYDRKLNIGTYKLEVGMSEEEIAKIITRTR